MAYTKAYKLTLQGTGSSKPSFIISVDEGDGSMSQSDYTAQEKVLADAVDIINAALTAGCKGWDDGAIKLTATKL
tara:strand:- start:126 stop:350 length:225 start_codon:yes stop_codon:yes gene_type:complete